MVADNHQVTTVADSRQEMIVKSPEQEEEELVPLKIVWRNVLLFGYLHLVTIWGAYAAVFQAKALTIIWTYVLLIYSTNGITAGAHRLWAHRTYKARRPLRVYLALANCLAFQNCVFEWARDHRVHHKFSETNADPHNARRGFFFSHMGWLITRKHPDVIEKGKVVDMSDLLADPVVVWQQKYYIPLVLIMGFLVPMCVATTLWGESLVVATLVAGVLRYVTSLHVTWLVNSAAHLWGDKPYDKNLNPAENVMVSILSLGEGYHNYHHTFPWDYAASEWGWQRNLTKFFIDMWAGLGLAYDLKRVPKEIVDKRRALKGDGSTPWFDEKSAMEHFKSL